VVHCGHPEYQEPEYANMTVTLHRQPLDAPALPALARLVLPLADADDPAGLAGHLVLLPSSRACTQLGHALLDAASADGRAALLLPRVTTPARLADHLADLLALPEPPLADPSLRAPVLAARLKGAPWLADRPEAAAGLAAEMVNLFDEVRLARRDAWLLDGADPDGLRAALGAAAAGEAATVLEEDLARVRDGWRWYREALPHDHVDRRLEAMAAAGRAWPGPVPAGIVAAHLGRLDRATLDMLRGLSDQGAPITWVTPDADAPRPRLLLASYRDAAAPTHPLAGPRLLAERVAGQLPQAPAFAGQSLRQRLDELGEARRELGPDGALRLTPCADPEDESRVVAAAVCRRLAAADDGPAPDIIVATADRDLAGRIAAQLRDAGVDVDDTRGRPLAGLPAGRLLRDVLRLVVAGWPFGVVFEVLTHPYVDLVSGGDKPGHAVRVQVLEGAVRRSGVARRGHGALRKLAEGDDQARPNEQPRSWKLTDLVDALDAAVAPLAALAGGAAAPWPAVIEAMRASWAKLAAGRPLDGADNRGDFDDVGALADLLDALAAAAPLLPDAPLADIAATVGGLLTEPTREVRPRRQRHLPVRIMGLVEARLEQADLLVLAGMSQDVFPGSIARPLFLADGVRRALDLEHWRARAGRDAELMLRLLAVAPTIMATWPRRREGQDSLPSPLVRRLAMVAPTPPAPAGNVPLYRRETTDPAAFATPETVFRAEPEPVPAPDVVIAGPLSHTSLQRYRDCPYRFLMADGLRLRRPQAVEAEFTAADHGNLVHAVMKVWLDPGSTGVAALAAGDRAAAAQALRAAADAAFDHEGKDLPGSAVALRAFLALTDELIDIEIARLQLWAPAALEAKFNLTVGEAAAWLAATGRDAPDLPDGASDVTLEGTIDRVDVRRGGDQAMVIDYKSGARPARKRVADGRLLQIHLYGLAVAAGAVEGLDGPRDVTGGGYYGLKSGALGLPKELHMANGGELQDGVANILDTVAKLLDPDDPYALVPDWQGDDAVGDLPCGFCEFRGVCRVEERVGTPALDRRLTTLLTSTPGGWS
jgi:ATP-dependent helicase/nuclease subunit B